MTDVLRHYLIKFGYDRKQVTTVVAGDKYVGVMLRDGQIGVCSTLHSSIPASDLDFDSPDLVRRTHRIVYNAYLNALLNHKADFEARKDIFDHIDFSAKEAVVMVGYFRPLVSKFIAAGLSLTVFDHMEEDDILAPLHELDAALSSARTIILTSTTLANGTFSGIVQHTADGSDIFLLGPSSILHPDMLAIRNIRKVYGSVFHPFDSRVLEVISQGHGTQTFQKYGQKVNI